MRLCTLGVVFGACLVINAHHANALFHVCDSSDHCQCWSSHVHHPNVEEFLGCCHPILCESGSDCGNAHVWTRNWVLCTCQQCWNVSRQKGYVALHNGAPFVPFVLLSTVDWRLAQFLQIFQTHTAPLPCQHRSDVGGSCSLVTASVSRRGDRGT